MIDDELLNNLVCPENRTRLHMAGADLVVRLNELIRRERLVNKSGQTVTSEMEAALVREDKALLYPVIDGIPIMLMDEGIPLDQLESPG